MNERASDEVSRLYYEYAPALFRYALTLNTSPEAAEDAVQEVFLRLHVASGDNQRINNPRAWLFRVLRNYILDELKSRANRGTVALENADESAAADNPEHRYGLIETFRSLSAALAPRELECVRLRAEGLRYEEIAEILCIRSGTVGALLARAHAKLRELTAEVKPRRRPEAEANRDVPADERVSS